MPTPTTPPPRRSPLAVASLVLGLLGLVGIASSIFGMALVPLPSLVLACLPAAAILGAVALRQINRAPSEMSGRGMARAGLSIGLVGIAVLVALLIAFTVGYDGR